MKKIIKAIKNPFWACGVILRFISPVINNDRLFISLEYFFARKRILHLNNPRRFNEKLQWLKLHCIHDEYTNLVDKYEVKQIVADKIGQDYIIPTLGVWNRFEEIDFDSLPDSFVLKCTHDSGGLVICTNKNELDKKKARKKIERCLRRKYFYQHREYPYRNVKPRIIAEKYMSDESGWQLKDYKVFCFNGEPRFIEVDYDRYVGHKLNVYDLDWNFVDFCMTSPNDRSVHIQKPTRLDEMIGLAKVLSKNTEFVRVDFYSINDRLYFGELTFHPGSGLIDFHPDKYDYILGDMLILPINNRIS